MKSAARLYFTFRSPYCWLAIRRLERVIPDMHDLIEFIPHWNPDPRTRQALRRRGGDVHYTAMGRAKHRYILGDVKRLAHRDGLRIVWPIDRKPRWEVPHLAWLAGRRAGAGAELYTEIVSARWERGEDICDPAVIHRIGVHIGTDADVLVSAAEDSDVQAEGIECMMMAWQDDIFGFPYFRSGTQRFWGLDRLPDFLEAIHSARDMPNTNPVPAPGISPDTDPYDLDTAGGCG